jgi:hypothetical protein
MPGRKKDVEEVQEKAGFYQEQVEPGEIEGMRLT